MNLARLPTLAQHFSEYYCRTSWCGSRPRAPLILLHTHGHTHSLKIPKVSGSAVFRGTTARVSGTNGAYLAFEGAKYIVPRNIMTGPNGPNRQGDGRERKSRKNLNLVATYVTKARFHAGRLIPFLVGNAGAQCQFKHNK